MSPKKLAEPLTNGEKSKLQLHSEQELNSLYRRYTLLENDRHRYLGGVKLARLNTILNILEKEHFNILTNLEVANNPSKKNQDVKRANNLNNLIESYDTLDLNLKKHKEFIAEIDDHIKNTEKTVVTLRTQQTSDRQHEDRVENAARTLDGLENKLDVQNKKFGIICAENEEMRQTIKKLLWDREGFLKSWNKMIAKLVLGKQFMMDLIEQATIAYDQREEWCSKLQALRLKAHYDLVYHTQEMRELKRKQNNNSKLEQFFSMKSQRRVMKDLQMQERIFRTENKQKMKKQISDYKKIVADIMNFAQESYVGDVVKKYCAREADNFSAFRYINSLIEDMELLSDQLGEIYLQIDSERLLTSHRQEQHNNILDDLETSVYVANQEKEKSEDKLKEVEDYLSKMCSGVEQLFRTCKCSNDPILQLLEPNSSINIFNVFLYIQIIEATINNVLLQVYTTEKILVEKRKMTPGQRTIKSDKEKLPLYTLSQIVPSDPCALCFEYELVSDVIDTPQFVFTREQAQKELRQRLVGTDFQSQKVHNVSACFLPKSRQILQKRYQE